MFVYYFVGGLILMVLLPTIYLKTRDYLDSKSNTVVISFDPPKDLNVLEVGYFFDNKVMFKDVLAWLMQYVLNGNLEIKKIGGDISVGILNKPNDLNEINELIWNKFFRDRTELKMQSLLRGYNTLLFGITMRFRDDLFKRDYLKQISRIWICLPILFAMLVYGGSEIFVQDMVDMGVLGRFVVFWVLPFVSLLLCVTAPIRTEKGKDLYRRLVGFRNFLKTAEKDREKFRQELLTRVDEKDRRLEFSTLLPYLVVLNVDKKWFETLVPELQEFVRGEDFLGFVNSYSLKK